MKHWKNLKLRTKLIGSFVSIVLLMMVVVLGVISNTIKNRMQFLEQKQISNTMKYVESLIKEYQAKSENYVKLFIQNSAIREACYYTELAEDRDILLNELSQIYSQFDLNSLEVGNQKGIVLVRAHNPDKFGDNKSDKEIVQKALQGSVSVDIETGNGGYAIRACGPIQNEDEIIGFIMTGIYLNDAFVQKIGQLSDSQLAVILDENIIASTFSYEDIKGQMIAQSKKLRDNVSVVYSKVSIQDVPHLNAFIPLQNSDGKMLGTISVGIDRTFTRESQASIARVLLVISLFAVLIALVAAVLLSLYITKPVTKSVKMLKDISEGDGDLTKRLEVYTNDEIGELSIWFNKFLDQLYHIISQITQSTSKVFNAVDKISLVSSEMATGAAEQSAQATEVATSVQEMTAAIIENSRNANQTAQIASQANENANKGVSSMQATQHGMEEIVNTTKQTGDAILSLSGRIDQIGEIIQVINDIADQTNLLALNAAIEAARAGEQGRGFAVVADEVRKLAERTTKATEEIVNTIKAIQDDTQEATKSMEAAKVVVSQGKEASVKTEEAFSEIVGSVTKVMDMIQQIATASEEQSSGAEQISMNVESISTVTSQSAQASEQMSGVADELSVQIDVLKTLVNKFKIGKEEEAVPFTSNMELKESLKDHDL